MDIGLKFRISGKLLDLFRRFHVKDYVMNIVAMFHQTVENRFQFVVLVDEEGGVELKVPCKRKTKQSTELL